MKYVPLLWANLKRNRVRTTLTMACVVIAFGIFGLMQTVQRSVLGVSNAVGADRLVTFHRVSTIQPLPLSYVTRVHGLEGILAACPHTWFGGIYQSERNPLLAYAVDPESFGDVFPEYEIAAEQRRAWLADRSSLVVGRVIAARFNWNIGDIVPLRSTIYTNAATGAPVWEFKIAAIYEAKNTENVSVFMHYDYFNQSHTYQRDVVGWIVSRVPDPDRGIAIAANLDALFANSPTETKTTSEGVYAQRMANQVGNLAALIAAIATAIFFTMVIVTVNSMSQSVRERTNEIAVMKSLGFSRVSVTALVLAEALLLTALGGAGGLLLAEAGARALSVAMAETFPVLTVPSAVYIQSTLLMVALGALSAAVPCVLAWRMKTVDALRRT